MYFLVKNKVIEALCEDKKSLEPMVTSSAYSIIYSREAVNPSDYQVVNGKLEKLHLEEPEEVIETEPITLDDIAVLEAIAGQEEAIMQLQEAIEKLQKKEAST